MNWQKFWQNFWEIFSDNPDEIKEIEGLVFRDTTGQWWAAMAPPNDTRVIQTKVNYNPWTGEELK